MPKDLIELYDLAGWGAVVKNSGPDIALHSWFTMTECAKAGAIQISFEMGEWVISPA